MPQGKWFRVGYAIIVSLLIVYLASLVDFIFNPIGDVLAALFVPMIVSGVFFYMLRPLVRFLSKRFSAVGAILLVYIAIIGLFVVSFQLIWPVVREQAIMLVNNFPDIIESLRKWLLSFQHRRWVQTISNEQPFATGSLTSQITAMLGDLLNSIVGSVKNVVNIAAGFLLLLGLVPFIVYYLLKEGHKFPGRVLKVLPERFHNETLVTLQEIDKSVGAFILSKVISSLIFGGLVFCGYLLIDLPYPLLLALVAAITNVIPYLGPILAGIPSVIVALTFSPAAALWVGVVLLVAHQIEGNLISPKIIGDQLNVHPLTIILLVIGADAIAGPLGMIIAIPFYVIFKIIAIHVYRFHKKNQIPKEPTILTPPK